MYKIRKISFQEHPFLHNLTIDFCGKDGKAVDTVIIAGENGTGKSTMLNELYNVVSHSVGTPIVVEFENGSENFTISYNFKQRASIIC